MKRRYLAFDIETAKELPDGDIDLKRYRPLGICCAATLACDADKPILWHGVTSNHHAADRMSQSDAAKLVDYLTRMVAEGYTILTWNGLGFDFDILAEESGLDGQCGMLALDHVDMMFHVFCQLGHAVGLDRAAKAMGLSGKPQGMDGMLAPRMWASGKRQQVLDYVAQDVRVAFELATACEERGCLRWVAHSGNTRQMPLPAGWLVVRSAQQLPEPDTSWMSNPWPRSKFSGWLLKKRTVTMDSNSAR